MKKYLLLFVFILTSFQIFSQPVYFNRRYDFAFSEKSNSIIEKNGFYYTIFQSQYSSNQNKDVHFCKLDSAGNILLTKSYPDSIAITPNNYSNYSLKETTDGGFIFLNGRHLLKLDINGDTLWTRNDTIYSGWCVQTADGNYALFSYYQNPWLLTKVDSSGNTLSVNTFMGFGFHNLIATSDNGFAGIFSWIYSVSTWCEWSHANVIKMDSAGNVQWSMPALPYPSLHLPWLMGLKQFSNNDIVAYGNYGDATCSFGRFAYLWRLDVSGNTVFSKVYDSLPATNMSFLYDVDEDSAGNILATGNNYLNTNKGLIAKFDSSGSSLWFKTYSTIPFSQSNCELHAIKSLSDGGIIASGFVIPAVADTGTQDAWIIKLDSMGCLTPGCVVSVHENNVYTFSNLTLFPNPAKNNLTVSGYLLSDGKAEIKVFDLSGRIIFTTQTTTPNSELNTQNLKKGIYFIQAGALRGKFVKE